MITKQKTYYAGTYLRLSQDDDLNSESGSISTQREKLNQYCTEKAILIVEEYCDDGWSGANFERPGFQKMLQDIYNGKINLVITKDLSRFGRNYLETGTFIEKVFTKHNVRYIAVDDNVDTLNGIHDIMMPIKNVINDLYSKDISRKTISALNTIAKSGKYIASKPTFGYMKDPNDKHRLIIDPKAAEVVKQIFSMASNSHGYLHIARYLTKNKILTPQSYWISENPNYFKVNPHLPHNEWNLRSVHMILNNIVYLGHAVYGRTRSTDIRSKNQIVQPEENWIINRNTHEAIISQELWDMAHKNLESRARTCKNGDVHMFAKLIFCNDCGRTMAFNNRDFHKELNGEFTCSTYKKKGKEYCTTHYITFENVYNYVLNDIKKHALEAFNNPTEYKEQLYKENIQGLKDIENQMSEIEKLKKRNAKINTLSKSLYEDKSIGIISNERFVSYISDYDSEQSEINQKIIVLEKQIKDKKRCKLNIDTFIDTIKKYKDVKELDSNILNQLISKIIICQSTSGSSNRKRINEIIIKYNV